LWPISITEATESGTRRMRASNSLEEAAYSSSSSLTFAAPSAGRTSSSAHQFERLARARRRGAKDELGPRVERAQVLGDPLRVPAPARRQRPLTIREPWVSPAGLRVPEEIEGVYRLRLSA
jgi:hypothetical protein